MSLVLTIDDEAAVRQSIRYFLEDYDFDVIEAEDGRQGLDRFEQDQPDLVLVDLQMPELDGLSVLKTVRERAPHTPIVIISGTGKVKDVAEALRLGAWDFLTKPITDLELLLHTVNKVMERADLIKENRRYQNALEERVEQRTQELEAANQELTQVNNRLKQIVESTRRISEVDEITRFGAQLLREFQKHMGTAGGSLYLVTEQGLQLLHALDPGHARAHINFPLEAGSVFDTVLKTRKPFLVNDIEAKKLARSGWNGYQGKSLLVFPLLGKNNQVQALLSLHNKENDCFIVQDKEIGAILASFCSKALLAAQTTEALRQNERTFRTVLAKNPVPMIITRADHSFDYFNDKFFELFGYSPEDVPDDQTWWAHAFPDPSYREHARACREAALEEAREFNAVVNMGEWCISCKDGSTREVEIALMPLDDLTVISMHDITQRKLAEDKIRRINRELEVRVAQRTKQLEQAHGELVENAHRVGMADIATSTLHNVGNILNSVNISLEELTSTVRNSKTRGLIKANEMIRAHMDNLAAFFTEHPRGRLIPEYFDQVGNILRTEQRVLEEELHFLDIKVSKMRAVMETQKRYTEVTEKSRGVPVVEIIEDALQLQSQALNRLGVRIERNYRHRPVCVINKVKLIHVLTNLIENAREAMEENKEACLVVAVEQISDKAAEIRIRDNGRGIPEDVLDKIFSLGFTTKPTGHGFGLHTSANLMTEMGGSLKAQSQGPGKGAEMILSLPPAEALVEMTVG